MTDIISISDASIRRASDILAAGGLVAFPTETVYGLGANGKQGVRQALDIIHKELDMTMALCGHRDIHNVTRAILRDSPF